MKEISLYIHIPFCKQKCLYCDFPSYSGLDRYMDKYIEALTMEILKKADKYLIRSIFIGGGTPSYLDCKNLKLLLKTINKLKFKNGMEFTIECNPGTLNIEKLNIMKEYNVNRLSMGLQSTNDIILDKIGRIHTFNDFKENYKIARNAGFNNINVDLMFGLPNQTLEDWEDTLNKIIQLKPEHISAYSLIIEEGTCFYKLYEENKLLLPDEEQERLMYSVGKKILREAQYHQYEISNFSRIGKECLHNKIYWKCYEYLGLGVSASSFIDGKRLKNIDNINKYIENIFINTSVVDDEYINSLKDNMEEYMFMGLRMIEGIDINDFKKRFGVSINEVYGDIIKKYLKEELLIYDLDRIKLTERGIEVSNYIMSDFIL